jgi:hypothetical protein
MSIETTSQTVRAPLRRPVPWLTVGLLTVVLAYADGFWLTSLQGAIGAIERSQGPFQGWLRGSTLTLPVFALAVLWALRRAARRYGPDLSRPRAVLAAALLVVAAGTLVAVGWLVASAVYDYSLQSHLIQVQQLNHGAASAADLAGMTGMAGMVAGTTGAATTAGSMSTGEMLQSTLVLHLRGIAYAGGLVLLTNVVLVGWALALRGGSWTSRRGAGQRRPAPAGASTA